LEDLEAGEIEYELAEEFLVGLKRKFGGGDKETVKVAELRKLEQKGKNNGGICTGVQKGSERKWI